MVNIQNITRFILSFEGISESPHFDKTSFRVNNKIVATLDMPKQKVTVKLGTGSQDIFHLANKDAIYAVPGSWGKQGWTIIDLNLVDLKLLKAILSEAYQTVASNKKHMKKESTTNFSVNLAAPASRALENAGVKTLKQLAGFKISEIMALHGMGKSSIPKLQATLEGAGLSFKPE